MKTRIFVLGSPCADRIKSHEFLVTCLSVPTPAESQSHTGLNGIWDPTPCALWLAP